MSRSYKKSPVSYILMPINGLKKLERRRYRRTYVIDEDNTESSPSSYRRYRSIDDEDIHGWKSYRTKNEFIEDFERDNRRKPTKAEIFDEWERWSRKGK